MSSENVTSLSEGHRSRLRARFLEGLGVGMADYEVLELALTLAIPRKDVKPLAKDLMTRFGSLKNVLVADVQALKAVGGVGDAVVVQLKLALALAQRISLQALKNDEICLDNRLALMDYLFARYADVAREEFVALFVDAKMKLLAAETLFTGSLTGSVAAPREILKRALAHNAAGLIVAHNHPSGVAEPSGEDHLFTRQLEEACENLGIILHDHVIVGGESYYSFTQGVKVKLLGGVA
ncbi:MAG: hypothetical protein COY40_00075 [Alphaproteobacteria bacterium CG_4_10_14_0_8_um_filter_53_9]|nr:MAG: hypothetical protein COY40_00075 [Alphaproteobacteria bacterium CG_4_10_14_0_8_um_filter_53_9]